jgi:hypothetical protein
MWIPIVDWFPKGRNYNSVDINYMSDEYDIMK